jgi:hypothetical protein
MIVKYCFVVPEASAQENQAMLDAEELARRFKRAMDVASPKISDAELARACGVEPQAITGWRKTGRIAKRHLAVIAETTGCGIDYLVGITDQPKKLLPHPDDEARALWSKYKRASPTVRQAIDTLVVGGILTRVSAPPPHVTSKPSKVS